MKIKAGIIGGAGYTGGETVRLLLRHPSVELVFVQSRSQAGKPLEAVHGDLAGETLMTFSPGYHDQVDVLFLCLSHGESKKLLTEHTFPPQTRIIDLGNDFRLGDTAAGRQFVYGLPELQRDEIRKASNIANPGCFATTIQLGLLPLAHSNLLGEVHTTGITGSTGAGQKLQETTHFTWRANNVSAYKTLTHQHLGEIKQTLAKLQPGFNKPVNFVPWRGDFTRGIFVTSIVEVSLSLDEVTRMYQTYYASHPFTRISPAMVDIKKVVNTNKCLIHLEKIENKLAVHSVTDNLLKGASGQAVQNMNLLFGLDETAGLQLKIFGVLDEQIMKEKIAIIGSGNLGTAIALGLIKAKLVSGKDIVVTRRQVNKLDALKKQGIGVTADNLLAVSKSGIIILCVQPKQLAALLQQIGPALNASKHILVSTITGISTDEISGHLNKKIPIVRAMPNTAVALGASMTCMCSKDSSDQQLARIQKLFNGIGHTLIIEERLMKAATVLAASGIAFFMRYIRAVTQGGIQLGFDSDEALEIAVQTAKGGATLLQENKTHPETEIDKVTTPEGCTIAGLNEMEHQGLSSALIKGIISSFEKISNIKK